MKLKSINKFTSNTTHKSKTLLFSEIMEVIDILTSKEMNTVVQPDYLAAVHMGRDIYLDPNIRFSDYTVIRGIYSCVFINDTNDTEHLSIPYREYRIAKRMQLVKDSNMVVLSIKEDNEKITIEIVENK